MFPVHGHKNLLQGFWDLLRFPNAIVLNTTGGDVWSTGEMLWWPLTHFLSGISYCRSSQQAASTLQTDFSAALITRGRSWTQPGLEWFTSRRRLLLQSPEQTKDFILFLFHRTFNVFQVVTKLFPLGQHYINIMELWWYKMLLHPLNY